MAARRKKRPTTSKVNVSLNMPTDLRLWLEQQAKANYTTMTSLICNAVANERAKQQQQEAA